MFVIRTEADRLRCIDAIREMPLYPVQQVDVYDFPKKRTDRQSKAMWSWSEIIGKHEGRTKTEVKVQAVMDAGLYDIKTMHIKVAGEYKEVIAAVPRETSGMKVDELAKILDQLMIMAHFHNLQLPYTEYI
jgi:hypothetical protein